MGDLVELEPGIEFPGDRGIRGLAQAFNGAWVWKAYCRAFGRGDAFPQRLRVRQFTLSPGRGAVVSYVLDWDDDAFLPPEQFSLRINGSESAELWRFPDDDQLPGLADAAHPDTALRLINRHVLAVPTRRVRVEVVRYRPGSRAVLRHSIGKVTFYVRVLRPAAVDRLVAAAAVIGGSSFVVPRIAGHWSKGGLVWLSRIPGRNGRRYIRRGGQPSAATILDGLESLWAAPIGSGGGRPLNLQGLFRRAKRILGHATQGNGEARCELEAAARVLDPFVASWQPTGLAHNDFYDDQMLLLPDGRIALVDFEETGPGDPMLDVGNFLAHLRIQAGLGRSDAATSAGAYHNTFRSAALDRLKWEARELNLREAVCLFRICTSTVRNIRPDWERRLGTGLTLVNEILN
jgi:aminoglycoside phosphotransferase (APT) family kinase protein